MVVCIIGKSGSGKDTVARLLQEWYNAKPVCSYTSRLKRKNETTGVEHIFVSKPEAEYLLKEHAHEVVAQTEIDGNLYFALKEDLEKADVYVIDPKGVEYLQTNFPEIPIFQLYVYCDDEVVKERVRDRGDDLEVYLSRHAAENAMFDEYYRAGKYDKVLDNSVARSVMENNLRAIMDKVLR